jgi:hypothetical protein
VIDQGTRTALSATAQRVLCAYGGAELWNNADKAVAEITMSGLAFRLKRRITPAHARITTEIKRPRTTITPIDKDGNTGILDGFRVTLVAPNGETLATREDIKQAHQNEQMWHTWDTLDLMYFLGYAFWSYFSLPYQLMRSDIDWEELRDGVLEAYFSPALPVHSRLQRFYFDQTGLLVRNDYHPEMLSIRDDAWAANKVLSHNEWQGIPYPSVRKVGPTFTPFGKAWSWIEMVGIRVDNWRLL